MSLNFTLLLVGRGSEQKKKPRTTELASVSFVSSKSSKRFPKLVCILSYFLKQKVYILHCLFLMIMNFTF